MAPRRVPAPGTAPAHPSRCARVSAPPARSPEGAKGERERLEKRGARAAQPPRRSGVSQHNGSVGQTLTNCHRKPRASCDRGTVGKCAGCQGQSSVPGPDASPALQRGSHQSWGPCPPALVQHHPGTTSSPSCTPEGADQGDQTALPPAAPAQSQGSLEGPQDTAGLSLLQPQGHCHILGGVLGCGGGLLLLRVCQEQRGFLLISSKHKSQGWVRKSLCSFSSLPNPLSPKQGAAPLRRKLQRCMCPQCTLHSRCPPPHSIAQGSNMQRGGSGGRYPPAPWQGLGPQLFKLPHP